MGAIWYLKNMSGLRHSNTFWHILSNLMILWTPSEVSHDSTIHVNVVISVCQLLFTTKFQCKQWQWFNSLW